MNFDKYEVLTFDCYGTLVDWESGIVSNLTPVLEAHGKNLTGAEILRLYSEVEPKAQQEDKFVPYKEVLRRVVRQLGEILGFVASLPEVEYLVEGIKAWKPFPDTVEALNAFKRRYKLAVISNVDDDLFEFTSEQLEVEFDWVITAEQVRSYKPSLRNFEAAIERMGVAPEGILHVAESLYHDIAPANKLGIRAVWVNRKAGARQVGASAFADARPALEVADLKSLASLMKLNPRQIIG